MEAPIRNIKQKSIKTTPPLIRAVDQQQASPIINYSRPLETEFAKWLEDFNNELLFLEYDLRGEYLDQSEDPPKWRASGDRMLNEKGIRYVIGELRSLCNKNTFMSNLERDTTRVYEIMLSFTNTVTDNIFYNQHEYGVEARHLDSIVEKCANITEFALRRPLYAGERGFIRDSPRSMGAPRPEGIFDRALGVFKGRG